MTVLRSETRKKLLRRAFLVVKVLLTVFLCTLILARADWAAIRRSFREASVPLLLLVFALMLAGVLVSALKWKLLLGIHRVGPGLGRLAGYYFTANFFNNFLPSTIGGDGYRAYRVLKDTDSKAAAVVPILVERSAGILVMLFLGLLGALGSYLMYRDPVSSAAIVLGSAGSLVLLLMLVFLRTEALRARILGLPRLPRKLRRLIEHLGEYGRDKVRFFQFLLVSGLFYLIFFSFWYLLVRAVGEECSFSSLVVVVTMSTLAAAVPISINGLGVLDGSFIYLAGGFGVAYESALMVMILQRALAITVSLIGGMVYLRDRGSIRREDMRGEAVGPLKESVS